MCSLVRRFIMSARLSEAGLATRWRTALISGGVIAVVALVGLIAKMPTPGSALTGEIAGVAHSALLSSSTADTFFPCRWPMPAAPPRVT